MKNTILLTTLLLFSYFSKAQEDKYPQLKNTPEWKYYFADSLGNPINKDVWDGARSFYGGVATVEKRTNEQQLNGLIDVTGKMLVPLGTHYITIPKKGFYTVTDTVHMRVYNSKGKLLNECQSCKLIFFDDQKKFVLQPEENYYAGGEDGANMPIKNFLKGIKVFDFSGRELYNFNGNEISRVVNYTGDYHHPQDTLPYFSITLKESGYWYYTVITYDGKVVIDSLMNTMGNGVSFQKEILTATKNNRAAIFDTKFKEILPFSSGYTMLYKLERHPNKDAFTAQKNGRYGVIDINNKIIVPIKYQYPLQYQDSIYTMTNPGYDSSWVFSISGDTLSLPGFRMVDNLKPGKYGVFTNDKGKYGFAEKSTRKVLIPAVYDMLIPPSHDTLIYFNGDTVGFVTNAGKRLFTFPVPCFGAGYFANGRAMCLLGLPEGKVPEPGTKMPTDRDNFMTKYVWVDNKGKIINNAAFDWFTQFENGQAMTNNDGQYFFVDTNMKRLKFQGEYDYQSYFSQGYAVIGQGATKFGLIDKNNKIVLPVIYDGIAMKDNPSIYARNSGLGDGVPYFDKAGSQARTNGFRYIPDINDGIITVTKNEVNEDIVLFGDKKPAPKPKPAIADSITAFYDFSFDNLPRHKDLEKEHMPLDGKEVVMIPFRQDELFGFVSKRSGNFIVKPIFSQVFGVYKDGAIVRTNKEGFAVIDTSGKQLFGGYTSIIREGNLYHCMGLISDSTLPQNFNLYASNDYYSDKGKFLFSEFAHDQTSFIHGDSLAQFRFGRTMSIRGRSGKLWKKFRLSTTNIFCGISNNLLVYRSIVDSKITYSAYDVRGKLAFSLPINEDYLSGPFKLSANLFAYYGRGGVFFVDAKGIVKPYGLDHVPEEARWNNFFANTRLPVYNFKRKKYGVIDATGKELIPFIYRSIGSFYKGYAIYADTLDKYGLMDSTGKSILYPIGRETLEEQMQTGKPLGFDEGLCPLKSYCMLKMTDKDGKIFEGIDPDSMCYRYIDVKGNTAFNLPTNIVMAGPFSDGLAPVLDVVGNFGFIDKTGKVVIPMQYEAMMAGAYPLPYLVVPEFINGYAYIKSYKGYIDKTGKQFFAGERAMDHYDFSH